MCAGSIPAGGTTTALHAAHAAAAVRRDAGRISELSSPSHRQARIRFDTYAMDERYERSGYDAVGARPSSQRGSSRRRLRALTDSIEHTLHRAVSYTHLRAHETDSYLVCRLL